METRQEEMTIALAEVFADKMARLTWIKMYEEVSGIKTQNNAGLHCEQNIVQIAKKHDIDAKDLLFAWLESSMYKIWEEEINKDTNTLLSNLRKLAIIK